MSYFLEFYARTLRISAFSTFVHLCCTTWHTSALLPKRFEYVLRSRSTRRGLKNRKLTVVCLDRLGLSLSFAWLNFRLSIDRARFASCYFLCEGARCAPLLFPGPARSDGCFCRRQPTTEDPFFRGKIFGGKLTYGLFLLLSCVRFLGVILVLPRRATAR